MIDPETYALFLKGRHFSLQRGAENNQKSEEAYLQAIELEPGYAQAWASLAMSYYDQTRFNVKTREDGVALAKNAIERAKSLDPVLGFVWGVDSFLKKILTGIGAPHRSPSTKHMNSSPITTTLGSGALPWLPQMEIG